MISICVITILFALATLIIAGKAYRRQSFTRGAYTTILVLQILTTILSLFHIYGLA